MNGITFYKTDRLGASYLPVHTWLDWGLILKEKPDVSFPAVKTKYIDLSGSNGQLDLTDLLTYDTKYSNRTGSFVFTSIRPREQWNFLKTEIANYLHGQRVKMILDEDLSYYWIGRFTINEWLSDKKTAQLTIDYDLEPFKYELYSTMEDYKWDTVNFETGIIRQWKDIRIEPDLSLFLIGSRKPVIPTLTVRPDDRLGFRVDGLYGFPPIRRIFTLPYGIYQDPNFVIRENTILYQYVFRAGYDSHDNYYHNIGTLSIEYRGGYL